MKLQIIHMEVLFTMKTVNLRTTMIVQVFIALCIPIYYHVMIAMHLRSSVPLFLVILVILFKKMLSARTEPVDEYARNMLRIADSVCYNISLVVMGVLVLPLVLVDGVPQLLIGYLLTWGIFLLVLARTCIFLWFDKRGME